MSDPKKSADEGTENESSEELDTVIDSSPLENDEDSAAEGGAFPDEEATVADDTAPAEAEAAAEESESDDDAPTLSVEEAPAPAKPAAPSEDEPVEPAEPGGPITFRVVGVTDVGLVREHNEDNYVVVDTAKDAETDVVGVHEDNTDVPGIGVAPDVPVDEDDIREAHDVAEPAEMDGSVAPTGFVFGVCDGMGGAAAGEVASKMAIDTVRDLMRVDEKPANRDEFARSLVHTIEDAGVRIYGAAKMDRSRRGMGTTATIAGLIDSTLFVGEIGDSRCYVLRNGVLKQITKDQSLVNQLIEAGQLTEEEAEVFEHNNIILQALGTTEEVTVDLTFLELRRGDRVMLCSDGLSGLVHNEVIRDIMASADPLPEIAKRLVSMAHMGGGHDNITCVLAEFDGAGLAGSVGAPEPAYHQYPLPPGEGKRRGGRAVGMKSGGRKPGADVKAGPIQHHAGAPDLPTGTFPWPAVAMVLLALVLLLGYFLFIDDSLDPEPPPSVPESMVVPDGEHEEPTPTMAEDPEPPEEDAVPFGPADEADPEMGDDPVGDEPAGDEPVADPEMDPEAGDEPVMPRADPTPEPAMDEIDEEEAVETAEPTEAAPAPSGAPTPTADTAQP